MDDSLLADIPSRTLDDGKIPFEALKFIPGDAANYYQFVPLGVVDGVLEVGMVDPDNVDARNAIQFLASKNNIAFKIFLISKDDFEKALKNYEGLNSEVGQALSEVDKDVGEVEKDFNNPDTSIIKANKAGTGPSIIEEAPVTKIVAVIVQHATSGNASDIHIEPGTDRVRVRFRVDGSLYTSIFLPLSVHDAVVARIKIMTNMKLDEKRKPQDGRFSAKVEGRKVDFRVSTLPTHFGEKVVIRILDPQKKLVNLKALGLDGLNLEAVKRAINRPYGLVLMTGPTGSGKSTTIYSMLQEMDREKYNIVSLEDPVEYDIPGVNQSQVRPEIGYTFANGLRSLLRQDPDIIVVGEMRDKITARLAIQAALTGHLVLSTLHTNSAIGVIPRLIDMGIDPYLISPTIAMMSAQRLVPMLVEDGKKEIPIEGGMRIMLEKQFADLPEEFRSKIVIPDKAYEAQSSPSSHSGTKGRIGVFETLEMDRGLEEIILKGPISEEAIYDYARKKGFTTMKEDAILKSFAGTIPFEEVNKL